MTPEAQALIDRYGPVDPFPRDRTAALVQALGVEVDPAHAFVCRYPNLASAEGFAQLNRHKHGYRVLGPFETESGVINVVDYRPAIEAGERRYAEWRAAGESI